MIKIFNNKIEKNHLKKRKKNKSTRANLQNLDKGLERTTY